MLDSRKDFLRVQGWWTVERGQKELRKWGEGLKMAGKGLHPSAGNSRRRSQFILRSCGEAK